MNRLQKSLALSFVLVCFPLGVLAQPQKVPSTQGQYTPRPNKDVGAGAAEMLKRPGCELIAEDWISIARCPDWNNRKADCRSYQGGGLDTDRYIYAAAKLGSQGSNRCLLRSVHYNRTHYPAGSSSK
jgi:hypothetical protein